jgi:hypothetical protein
MRNIENLKKQAKQYLRWHRERYYPVAARIRAGLPRFSHLSDDQVLDASFKLADAQDLVARERGFEGWQALKSGAHAVTQESMTHEAGQTVQRPVLNSTEAQLFVADIQKSCDFYTDKLGFTVAFVWIPTEISFSLLPQPTKLAGGAAGRLWVKVVFQPTTPITRR